MSNNYNLNAKKEARAHFEHGLFFQFSLSTLEKFVMLSGIIFS